MILEGLLFTSSVTLKMFAFSVVVVYFRASGMAFFMLWRLIFVMIVNIAIVGPPSLQIRLKLSLGITLVLLTITTRVTAATATAAT